MTPEQLLSHFKVETKSDLARAIEKPVSTVNDWFQKGRLPKAVQYEFESKTRGKLKANIQ